MLELHPQFIEKNGRREFAVLPIEEYQAILRELGLHEAAEALHEIEAAAVEAEVEAAEVEEAEKHLRL